MSSTNGGPAANSFSTYDSNAIIVIVTSALAGYNAVELLLLIFTTFTHYAGLYFWSILIATSGVIPYVIGLCVFYFEWTNKLAGYITNNVGWVTMVTGQSVVLYSRLGIVLGSGHDRLLRFIKWMIIVDGIVFHVTTTVVVFCSHYAPNTVPFEDAYRYVEKIQMTGFSLQELIISGIYVWKTVEILQTAQNKHKTRIMWQLFTINVIIIILDIGLLVLEYKNLFIPEVAFKQLSYSIKLKLEFAILSKLVEVSQSGQRRFSTMFGDTTGFLDDSGKSHSFATGATLSPALTSASRPQWTHDVEKINNEAVQMHGALQEGSTSSSPSNSDHNFDSEAICGLRYNKHDTDLLYADAMRCVSK